MYIRMGKINSIWISGCVAGTFMLGMSQPDNLNAYVNLTVNKSSVVQFLCEKVHIIHNSNNVYLISSHTCKQLLKYVWFKFH